MRVSTRVVLLLALLASLLSFAKFNHCASTGWQSPDQYVHACYSDIPALYGERGLDKGVWAYSAGADSVEYPVIQGVIIPSANGTVQVRFASEISGQSITAKAGASLEWW